MDGSLMTDINCDMGEGMHTDEDIMPYITTASIACGYHAGDEATIRRTITLAQQHGVRVGPHISFADREYFGRREMNLSAEEIYALVKEQLILFGKIATEMNVPAYHVKPHGALYNMMAKDKQLATVVAAAIKDTNRHLIVYGLSGSLAIETAQQAGLRTAQEAFADRSYQDDGSLTLRTQAGAVYADADKVVQQVLLLLQESKVRTLSGKLIQIHADTICIHGDSEDAVSFAKAIAAAINKNAG